MNLLSLLRRSPDVWLQKLWRGAVHGYGPGRWLRYALTIVAGLTAIWALAIAYLMLTPESFSSRATLVLPGTGSGAAVTLERIGQASSLSASPFGNHRVDPVETYKLLLQSDRVLDEASQRFGDGQVEGPRIKTIDQTQLMLVSLSGPSPEAARAKMVALLESFFEVVDALRMEEIELRESGYTEMLAGFEQGLVQARNDVLAHQIDSGLASLDQYYGRIEKFEAMRRELVEAEIDAKQKRAVLAALETNLGLPARTAAAALALGEDPIFKTLAAGLAQANGELAATEEALGAAHPRRKAALEAAQGFRARLTARGRAISELNANEILDLADIHAQGGRADLLQALVNADIQLQAAQSRQDSLEAALAKSERQVRELGDKALKLDDLVRSQQVAEAVFRSAMARIDTNKADLFASYPLVQVYEAPNLPTSKSAPLPMLAILGAGLGSVFYITGLFLIWLRLPLIALFLKKE